MEQGAEPLPPTACTVSLRSVTNDGSGKSWVFRWTVPGARRERVMGLGPAHTVDLDEAPEKARDRHARKLLLAGKGPLIEREQRGLDRDIAAGLAKRSTRSSMNIGTPRSGTSRAITSIDRPGCSENTCASQSARCRSRSQHQHYPQPSRAAQVVDGAAPHGADPAFAPERIFSLAIANRCYRGDDPAAWVGHLEHILPRSKDVHRAEHHSWVPYQDIGRFMAKLRAWEDQSCRRTGHTTVALLLEFVVLTAVRVSEARLATWNEFDFDGLIWNVPPEKLKTGHLNGQVRPVPITPPMLAVLKEMKRRRKDDAPDALVFPSPRGGGSGIGSCSQFIRQSLKWEAKTTVLASVPRLSTGPREPFSSASDRSAARPRARQRGQSGLRPRQTDQGGRAMMRQSGDYCSRPHQCRPPGPTMCCRSQRGGKRHEGDREGRRRTH